MLFSELCYFYYFWRMFLWSVVLGMWFPPLPRHICGAENKICSINQNVLIHHLSLLLLLLFMSQLPVNNPLAEKQRMHTISSNTQILVGYQCCLNYKYKIQCHRSYCKERYFPPKQSQYTFFTRAVKVVTALAPDIPGYFCV